MNDSAYKLVAKFNCCGVDMVTVIINGKAACVMPELEYKRVIANEQRFLQKSKLRAA